MTGTLARVARGRSASADPAGSVAELAPLLGALSSRARAHVTPRRSVESGVVGRPGLLGRAVECAVLDELVGAIRGGESRSLLLRGEPGIGKTALLEYLVESASDMTLVRSVGVESEMELAYASLHQVCAPLLDRLPRLPAPQRQALEIVFGLSTGAARTAFLSGSAS